MLFVKLVPRATSSNSSIRWKVRFFARNFFQRVSFAGVQPSVYLMAAVAVVPVQQAVVSPFDSEIVEGQVFEQHVDVMLFLVQGREEVEQVLLHVPDWIAVDFPNLFGRRFVLVGREVKQVLFHGEIRVW